MTEEEKIMFRNTKINVIWYKRDGYT
jgi:hypothetical protein